MGRNFKFQVQDSFFGIFFFGDLKNELHFLKKKPPLVARILEFKISDFLNSNMCFCSRLYGICFLFRDRGISVQLIKYQMYTEICVYTLVIFFLVFLPVEKEILLIRIIGILNTFLVYVVQPLFYLSGDVNFRNRVLRKGLWLAIKTELFETPNAVRLFSSKSAMRG